MTLEDKSNNMIDCPEEDPADFLYKELCETFARDGFSEIYIPEQIIKAYVFKMPIGVELDSSTNWIKRNPTLPIDQFGYEEDTNKFKIGDGITPWAELNYVRPPFYNQYPLGTLVNLPPVNLPPMEIYSEHIQKVYIGDNLVSTTNITQEVSRYNIGDYNDKDMTFFKKINLYMSDLDEYIKDNIKTDSNKTSRIHKIRTWFSRIFKKL